MRCLPCLCVLSAVASDVGFQEGRIADALRSGIIRADQAIIEQATSSPGFNSGSTAVVCCVVGETLYTANLGDSEALLGRRKPDHATNPHPYEPVLVSFKHKPSDEAEKERITQAGAAVFKGRIFGRLAVSRALGDCEFKIPKAKANYVSNEPFVGSFPLDDTYDFLVLACDGLWDKLTYQDVVDIVSEQRKQGMGAEQISEFLCNTSLQRNSMDNISAIVVFFQWRST
jgi:integrin-linked kinase-associated serine/threonine phosphatase 2C